MSPWADLRPELLELILSKLSGKDIAVFRTVCRGWNSVPSPHDSDIHPPISDMVKYPFLCRSKQLSSSSSCWEFYSPAYNKTYLVDAPQWVDDARIHASNHGWLLLSNGNCDFFFLHPSTGHAIKLPRMSRRCLSVYNAMTFWGPPTSPGCTVFGIVNFVSDNRVRFAFIRRGDDTWVDIGVELANMMGVNFNGDRLAARCASTTKSKWLAPKVRANRCRFRPIRCKGAFSWSGACSSPVRHMEAFYCLGPDGMLGVFDPHTDDMWRLLDTRCNLFPGAGGKAYLMESSRGELISVAVGPRGGGDYVRVFKFDHRLKLWQSVGSLGDQVAFVSHTCSVICQCKELNVKGFDNTIHFPRFDGNHNVFYSLSTGRFHSFRGGYASDHMCHTQVPLNSTWNVVPEFPSFSDRELDWPEENIDNTTTPARPSYFTSRSIFSQPSAAYSRNREANNATTNADLVDINNVSYSRYKMQEMLRGKRVYGSNKEGKVMVVDLDSNDCVLLDTSSMATVRLPTLKTYEKFETRRCMIHENPEDSKTMVTVFERGSAVILFCRVGDEEWTTCREEEGGEIITVIDVVAHQGMIYGLGERSKHGHTRLLVELELQQKHYKVKAIEEVEFPEYRSIRTHARGLRLFQSCGEILLLERCLSELDYNDEEVVVNMRVYKLDTKTMRWEVVDDLGDRVFFFSSGLAKFGWCRASKSGLPRNNVYFIEGSDDEDDDNFTILKYDCGNRSISTAFSCHSEIESRLISKLGVCYWL